MTVRVSHRPAIVTLNVSRYAGGKVALVLDADGAPRQVPEVRTPLRVDQFSGILRHIVVEGEHLDGLAMQYLGDSRLWWVLADLNADILAGALGTLVLTPGAELLVPVDGSFTVTGQR